MAFLDFIKQRRQPGATAKAGPATAMPQPGTKTIEQSLTQDSAARAKRLGQLLSKATVHMQGGAQATDSSSNAALLQKQNNQDKVQAALSPTDRFKGKTALQKSGRGWER